MKKILLIINLTLLLITLTSCNLIKKVLPKYRVSFYLSNELVEEILVEKETLIKEPLVEITIGYEIIGWYKNLDDESSKWDFNYNKVEGNLRLDAKLEMKENYLTATNVKVEDNLITWDNIDGATYLVNEFSVSEPSFDLSNLKLKNNEEIEVNINIVKDNFKSIVKTNIISFKDLEIIESYNLLFEEFDFSEFKELNRSTYKSSLINLDDHHLFINEGRLTNANEYPKSGLVSLVLRKDGFIEFLDGFNNFRKLKFNISGRNEEINHSKIEILAKNENSDYILVKEVEIDSNGFSEVIINSNDLTSINLEENIYFKMNTNIKNSDAKNNIIIDDIYFFEEVKSHYLLKSLIDDNINLTDYYKSANNLKGEALVLELREILKTNLNPISYKDIKTVLEFSDVNLDDSSKVVGIYDQQLHKANWGQKSDWHREHVWPNSRLGMDRVKENEVNQGSDPHNLRAITPRTNSSRSNRFFDLAADPLNSSGHTIKTDAYYPGDLDKGDVARILMYMVIRYEFLGLTNDLSLLGRNAYAKDAAFMGLLKNLLTWHNEDPVDEFEINRNEIIYSYQGNRNPFIDHPELFSEVYNYLDNIDETRVSSIKTNLIDEIDITFIKRYNYIDYLSI